MAELNLINQETNILSQLRFLHLPKAASNWPPAPGWIFLFIVLGSIAIWTGLWAYRNYPIWQTKKHALNLLKQYEKQYPQTINCQKACSLINELLKKTAFFYYPRPMVASLRGKDWLNFLNQTFKQQPIHKKILCKILKRQHPEVTALSFDSVAKELLEYPYQNNQNINLTELFLKTRLWITSQHNHNKSHQGGLC